MTSAQVIDALKAAGKPLTTDEIVDLLGLPPSLAKKRVVSIMSRAKRDGQVRNTRTRNKMTQWGVMKVFLWELIESGG